VKYKSTHRNKNGGITQGIKISYESRDINDAVIEAFYIKYCKILNEVI
jgi:hypothetical protein